MQTKKYKNCTIIPNVTLFMSCLRVLEFPFYHLKSANHRESHSDVSTDHFIRTVQTEHRTTKKGMSLNRLRLKSIRDDLR